MTCPQCKHEQVCGCSPCRERNPVEKPYVWVGGVDIACGNCGWVMDVNDWEAFGYADYKRWKKANAKV